MASSDIEEPITKEKEIQILHLEDDAFDAELIQATLDSAGISVCITCVQSASEFSKALNERQYELILADYHLPAYDGVSALRFLKENYPDIPFIFVSGMMGEDAAINGLTQGATDYVLKNKLARLVPAVQRALKEAENRKKRKQMEQELVERERKFRTLAENSPDNITRYDVNCRALYVNPCLEKTLGRSASEILGTTPIEAALIDEAEEYQEKIVEVLETGKEYEMDIVLPDRGEGARYHNIRFVAERGADGAISGVQTIGRDITERINTENALRESEEKFRSFVESSSEGFTLVDEQGMIIEWNLAREKMTGIPASQAIGRKLWDVQYQMVLPELQTPEFYERFRQTLLNALQTGQSPIFNHAVEVEISHPQRPSQIIRQTIFPIKTDKGYRIGSVTSDITERKRMEDALRVSEERLQLALDAGEMGQWEWNIKTGEVVWSQQCLALYGLESDTLMSYAKFLQVLHPEDRERVDTALRRAVEERTSYDEVKRTIWPDDSLHWTASRGQVYCDAAGKPIRMVGVTFDVSKWKEAEEERQAHVCYLENMDLVNRVIQGANDLEQMMSDVLDIVLSIFDCDRAFLMYPLDPDASSWFSPMERTRPEFPGILALGIDEMPMDMEVARTFRIMLEADGPVKFGLNTPNPLPTDVAEHFDIKSLMSMALYPKLGKPWQFGLHQCSYERTWTPDEERLFQEVGRRLSDALTSLLAHRHLQESEERYRLIAENTVDTISVFDLNLKPIFISPSVYKLRGYTVEEAMTQSLDQILTPASLQMAIQMFTGQLALEASGTADPARTALLELEEYRKDGSTIWVELAASALRDNDLQPIGILTVSRDITERKQHEREHEAIITVSTALRHARTRQEILNVILDQLVGLFDADGTVLVLPDPKTGDLINEMGSGTIGKGMIGLKIPPGKGVSNWVITKAKPYLNNRADQDPLFYRPDLLGDSHCLIAAPLIAQEQAIGVLLVARQVDFDEQDLRLLTALADIAANAIHRVTLHEQTEQQLHRLVALHQIDLAISANFDLKTTLNVILGNVKDELEVDAASILLLDPVTHTLDYVAGIGFRTHNIEQSHVGLGEGCAGRAAQELRTISCLDIAEGSVIFVRASLLAGEDFVSHYATPLVMKGQIKGVLEIFHHVVIEPEAGWLNYFETLATQAAIAIESASLFENLQRSNLELTLAYDATIEGWSRALDLRDRETEGHTQRVAEMALELAKKMEMSEGEKMDLRRGALLHDIGKMGVPDAILHKPGPLSDHEWKVMRQHPLYAYQMLSPITYLRRALEIPYCHHEKWDGSGYPRGLKGDEIPLSARVFAVVDVFDALTSDRPYRKAWSHREAYHYIEEQANKSFDPQVVKIFLETRENT